MKHSTHFPGRGQKGSTELEYREGLKQGLFEQSTGRNSQDQYAVNTLVNSLIELRRVSQDIQCCWSPRDLLCAVEARDKNNRKNKSLVIALFDLYAS